MIPQWMKLNFISVLSLNNIGRRFRRKVKRVISMQQVFVKFNDADQVRNFVNAVSTVDANFELGSGRRVVDAKSIMGIFSMDLSTDVELRILETNEKISEIEKVIAPYLIW